VVVLVFTPNIFLRLVDGFQRIVQSHILRVDLEGIGGALGIW
jgi:hypothetical protein